MLTLLVRNLPNKISQDSLKKFFTKFGEINWIKKKKSKIFENTYLISLLNKTEIFFNEKNVFSTIINGKEIKIQKIRGVWGKKVDLKKLTLKKTKCYEIKKIETNLPEGSLEVINFHQSITEKEVLRLFGHFGHIIGFRIKETTKFLKNSKKVSIRYAIPECALKAACFFEKKIYKGNVLRIQKINTIVQEFSKSNDTTFKIFKKLQNDNNNNKFCLYNSWISLFVNHSNIHNIFDQNYGERNFPNQKIAQNFFSKSRLLISQGKFRTESKLSLNKEGVLVNLFPFSNILKRSRRFFFVKYKLGDDEFFSLEGFKKFGKVKNFYFFFRTNMIIVGYKKSSDARIAFKNLQKRLVGDGGRLMDWVPFHFEKKRKFSSEFKDYDSNTNIKFRNNSLNFKDNNKKLKSFENLSFKNNIYKKVVTLEKTLIKDLNFNVEKKNPNSFCFFSGKLIVRNIPFKTKINNLKKIFSIFGKILSIRLPKKKNGENRGFAFIKYNNLNDAKKALFFVQNTKIDSRSLRVNLIK
jgi:RNA recognition motif-containing protein